jgi:hypothetical protein
MYENGAMKPVEITLRDIPLRDKGAGWRVGESN